MSIYVFFLKEFLISGFSKTIAINKSNKKHIFFSFFLLKKNKHEFSCGIENWCVSHTHETEHVGCEFEKN